MLTRPVGWNKGSRSAHLAATAGVNLAYNRGTATLPVDWNLSGLDTSTEGTHQVTGTVRSIGANLNQWVGAGGSTAWNAANRQLFSSTALTVTAQVVVTADAGPSVTLAATTRCVAGKVVLATTVTNEGSEPVDATVTTPYGSKTVSQLAAGKSVSQAFSTRVSSVSPGVATAQAYGSPVEAAYAAVSCG